MQKGKERNVFASSHNMSSHQSGKFGVRNLRKRAEKVQVLTEKVNRTYISQKLSKTCF